MKRANGTGCIVKYKGNRRRPYVVRVTAGFTPEGKQITKVIGSYATEDDATAALLDYNKTPYDIEARKITMAELYERWLKRALTQQRLAKSTFNGLKSAFGHCTALYDIPYHTIKAHMMQECVDNCGCSASTQLQIKQLFYQLDRYAYEFDITDRRYSELIRTSSPAPKPKKLFNDAEVYSLWENKNAPWVDTVLILLYSGWRISELLGLLKKDISIDPSGKTVNYMKGGVKTKAGKDRYVPIHSAILPLVKLRYARAKNYLIENDAGKHIVPYQYYSYWHEVMRLIGAKHTVHETRHTFRTWLDRTPARLSCVNRIMGHTCSDIGLQTYTIKTLEELRDTIELIKSI